MKILTTILFLVLFFSSVKSQTMTDKELKKHIVTKITKIHNYRYMTYLGRDATVNDMHYPYNATDTRIKKASLNYNDMYDYIMVEYVMPFLPDTNYRYFSIRYDTTSTKNTNIAKSTGGDINSKRRPERFDYKVRVNKANLKQFYFSHVFGDEVLISLDKSYLDRNSINLFLRFGITTKNLEKLTFEKESKENLYYRAKYRDNTIKQIIYNKEKSTITKKTIENEKK